VAQFFKDTLGDRLVEYAPATAVSSGSGSHPRIATGNTGELAPSDTRSSARLAGAASNSGTGSGSRPNLTGSRPGTGSGPRPNPNPAPARTGSGPRPIPAAAQPPQPPPAEASAAGMEAEASMRQAAGQQSRPSQTGQRAALSGSAQAAQAPPSSSTRSGIRTMPTTGAPAPAVAPGNPSQVGAMAQGPTTSQRAAMAAQSAAVATAPVQRPSTQVATVGQSPRSAVSAPAPAQSRVAMPAVAPAPVPVPPAPAPAPAITTAPASSRRGLLWVLVALVVLAILGFIASRFLGGSGGLEVVNLGPGERLYIGGIRVDGSPRFDKPGALLVSTAVDGRLRRFGRTERRDRIDVRTIPEALPQPGSGTLIVSGDPSGCRVKVGNDMLPNSTPIKAPIEAGKELDVLVTCPSGVTSTSVLAVPGQEVLIDLRPKK
jgi:hypothetical protein